MLVRQSVGKLSIGCSYILTETRVGADSPVISVLYCTDINLATVLLTG
jgi:hypothetical protein